MESWDGDGPLILVARLIKCWFEAIGEIQFDLNANGKVNILDLVLVAQAIGKTDSTIDVNDDGTVNVLDLRQIANHI